MIALDRLRAFIQQATWVFAKTMAHIPHEYTNKFWYPHGHPVRNDFDWFVTTIRTFGYDRLFGKRLFRYLDVDGLRYWTMGAAVEETFILNRAVTDLYHTALAGGPQLRLPPTDHYELQAVPGAPPCLAFRHDVADGLHPAFLTCDLIYGEPPWPRGQAIFDDRAGVPRRSYDVIVNAITAFLWETDLPVVMCGPRNRSLFPKPDTVTPVRVRGGKALLYGYRIDLTRYPQNVSTAHVLAALAQDYARIGDPFAGCGLTGRVAARYQRTWVLSDHVGACITYIAMNAPGWYAPHAIGGGHAGLPAEERAASDL